MRWYLIFLLKSKECHHHCNLKIKRHLIMNTKNKSEFTRYVGFDLDGLWFLPESCSFEDASRSSKLCCTQVCQTKPVKETRSYSLLVNLIHSFFLNTPNSSYCLNAVTLKTLTYPKGFVDSNTFLH